MVSELTGMRMAAASGVSCPVSASVKADGVVDDRDHEAQHARPGARVGRKRKERRQRGKAIAADHARRTPGRCRRCRPRRRCRRRRPPARRRRSGRRRPSGRGGPAARRAHERQLVLGRLAEVHAAAEQSAPARRLAVVIAGQQADVVRRCQPSRRVRDAGARAAATRTQPTFRIQPRRQVRSSTRSDGRPVTAATNACRPDRHPNATDSAVDPVPGTSRTSVAADTCATTAHRCCAAIARLIGCEATRVRAAARAPSP